MSYQVLARKYRPKSFATLVGQEHVVRALSHALDQQRLHHAYLFTGTRGVGKTTLSRILAKSFNCEKGITSTPCGDCDTCVAIDAGRFVDYIEMDAASNRGVDEMAALLEQAVYAPSNARFKVYMIDEVHMLTNHAFNAMLKTLEEPPAHVKFILATTDPQKIPMTVLSRCLQFNLKQMPPGHIISHLDNILGQEHIEFEAPALRLLAQGAHGSMRDALSLTDQAIAYAAGKVTLDAVQSMLGSLDQSYLIRLLDALSAEDGKALLDVADEMAARSLSYKAALQDLGTLLNQIAIAQLVPTALAEELPEREHLMRLASVLSKEEVQLFYQIAVHGRNEIGLAPDEYAGFTMTLLRMLAFRPQGVNEQIGHQGDGSGAHVNAPKTANLVRPSTVAQTRTATMPSTANAAIQVPEQIIPAANNAHVGQTQANYSQSKNPQAIEQNLKPVSTGAKPLSPAMAALAAARAGSSRAAQGPGKSLSLSTSSVTSQMPSVPVIPTTPVASTPTSPVILQTPVVQAVPTALLKTTTAEEFDESMMPPPWDDEDFASSAQMSSRYSDNEKTEFQLKTTEVVNASLNEVAELAKIFVDSSQNASREIEEVQRKVETSKTPERAQEQVKEITETTEVKPLVLMPMAQIAWDGHWPNLAASLPVRGVAQQLAQQSELKQCTVNGNAIVFKLCVPLQTLLSSGSLDKLTTSLNEKFAQYPFEVRIETEIGAVEQTANAQANAEKAERLLQAEKNIQSDNFVQALIKEFGASILTGSIRPI
jgi:DNA polymerase-3 subunit gamma/tau